MKSVLTLKRRKKGEEQNCNKKHLKGSASCFRQSFVFKTQYVINDQISDLLINGVRKHSCIDVISTEN